MAGGNYGKASEAYQQAVYRDGKNPAFWCSIGVLYYQINQFHDALDAVSRSAFLTRIALNKFTVLQSNQNQSIRFRSLAQSRSTIRLLQRSDTRCARCI